MAEVTVKWNPGAKNKLLKEVPDRIMYEVASMTLDMAYTTIPLSNKIGAGNLRKTSKSAGVRGSDGNYYIGSYTNYAKYVWEKPDSTKWSTPGTNAEWYKRYWQKHGKSILKNAIERNKLK